MSQRNFKHKHHAQGLSLIELMIAMVIGLVLLLGLIQVMGASRAAYQLSTGVARTQENARFAVDFLQRDMRMAGHMGCVNDQAHMAPERPGATDASRQGLNLWFLSKAQRDVRNYPAIADFPLRFDMGVQGFEAQATGPGDTRALAAGTPVAGAANQWSPALPNAISRLNPIAGSDIIVVRYLSRDGVPATLTAASATSYTITPETYGSEVSTTDSNGLFGLADCQQASVFASNNVDSGSGAVSATVAGLNASGLNGDEWSFEGSSQNKPVLYRAEAIVYYVGIGSGTNADGTRPPSLFRARAVNDAGTVNFVPEELVEGVESMQLLYGMDEHLPNDLPRGNVERTRVASTVNTVPNNNPTNAQSDEWRRVGTVQVGLLMRSSDRSAAEQSTTAPKVLGLSLTRPAANDAHYRSVYETTVVLRNRLFGN